MLMLETAAEQLTVRVPIALPTDTVGKIRHVGSIARKPPELRAEYAV